MKLSLCIATYNEEKFIRYPMDSAYDLVDEVIIVDGGSTDRTVEIVKSYGAKVRVIPADNPPMFHINKEKAIKEAKGEWILQLDADEALSDELKKEISEVIKKDAPVAYWIPRKNYFLGRFLTKGGVYPDHTIRLYKNGAAHFPCRSVHENVVIKGEAGYLKSPLLHYADPEFSRYLKRWHRYTGLDADILIKEGKKPNTISYLLVKPVQWFFSTYVRHLGFLDSWQGFVFHFMSSIRFWAVYFKWQEKIRALRVKAAVDEAF
jgi:glycosyltransferase involved in cell wall biosynthesis